MLLHFIGWLKANTDWDFEILLRAGGELELRYAELGPTWLFEGSQINPKKHSVVWSKIRRKLTRVTAFYNIKKRRRLLQLLRSREFDLIYSNTITNGEVLEWLAPLAIPVITHVHEMSHWIKFYGPENLASIRKYSKAYIAASHAVKRELNVKFDFPIEQISVVHEFIPTLDTRSDTTRIAAFRHKLGITPDSFVVVGSGIETWRKGKDLFVDLAEEIVRRQIGRKVYFLWVGAWQHPCHQIKLRKRLRKSGLKDRVRFIGQVTNPLDYFAASDAFAMTSREDPYPLVCLEAALMEIPILCFADAGGMPEFVEDDAGLVVPYLDIVAMADGIAKWACNRELAKSTGARAATKVRERHDVDKGSRLIHKLIQDVIECNLSHRN